MDDKEKDQDARNALMIMYRVGPPSAFIGFMVEMLGYNKNNPCTIRDA